MISPSAPLFGIGFQKTALSLKNAKCTTFHQPHKGPPSSQLHRHNQTRDNYIIRLAGADRDPQMVCWCVIFTLSDNEESLALSEEAAAECVCGAPAAALRNRLS